MHLDKDRVYRKVGREVYVVSARRTDERITIEGLTTILNPVTQLMCRSATVLRPHGNLLSACWD